MRKLIYFLLIAIMFVVSACSQALPESIVKAETNDDFVFVTGGAFKNTKSNHYGEKETVPSFYIGKNEVTQKEWIEIMGSNPSQFKGENLPIEMVSWYDAVEYSNKRSIKEGLKPYYNIDENKIDPNNKSEYDNMKWTVTINAGANGYRLPTEMEWQYAASGGQLSQNYTYSGSDNPDDVAWYWKNAGDENLSGDWNWPKVENNHNKTKSIGIQKPNELGLYDMSGNVREWCWDWYVDPDGNTGATRVVKGGGWMGEVGELSYMSNFEANGFGPDQGFRLVRSE
jgi:sulfatase modifying factor 1